MGDSVLTRGNVRLWVVLSGCWIAGVAWIFWPTLPPLPTLYTIDTADYVSAVCSSVRPMPPKSDTQLEEEAEEIVQEKFRECVEQHIGGADKSLFPLGPAEQACAPTDRLRSLALTKVKLKNQIDEINIRNEAASVYEKCLYSSDAMAELAAFSERQLNFEKSKVIKERNTLWFKWGALVFMPPLVVPLLFLLGLFAYRWVSEGYRNEN